MSLDESKSRTETSADSSPAIPSTAASVEEKTPKTDMAEKQDMADVAKAKQEYPQGWKFWLIYAATLLNIFLVPLDMTIVATAIPKITQVFHSLDEVGWYGSTFFLTLAVFQSPWGKIYKYYPMKICYASSVFIFELGSLICGAAHNSHMLIAGRIIAGLGGAGLTIGTYVIISHLVPPAKVFAFTGGIGAAFSIASVAGPLVGGALTGQVTWRLCFYINLPIGGTASLLFFALFPKPNLPRPQASLKEKFLQLDVVGTILAISSIICYFLALQWGGVTKSWRSAPVVSTLVGSALLAIAFGVVQWYLGPRASIIPQILVQRYVAGGSAFMFLLSCANFLMIYNLPLYFQSVKGSSPTLSGIQVLPLIVSASIFVIASGILFMKFPYYQLYLLIGASFTAVGAGLLYTLQLNSGAGKYLGYQFVVGFGNGICQQIPLAVVQSLSKPEDIATSLSIVLFFQLLSGALAIAAAQSLFINRLLVAAARLLPTVSRENIIETGATSLQRVFTADELPLIRKSYLEGLHAAWAMAIVFAGIALLVGLTFGWGKIVKAAELNGDEESGKGDGEVKVAVLEGMGEQEKKDLGDEKIDEKESSKV